MTWLSLFKSIPCFWMYNTRWQYSIQLVCFFSMWILHFTSLGISTIFSIALRWLCSGVPSLTVSFESEASAPSPRGTWWGLFFQGLPCHGVHTLSDPDLSSRPRDFAVVTWPVRGGRALLDQFRTGLIDRSRGTGGVFSTFLWYPLALQAGTKHTTPTCCSRKHCRCEVPRRLHAPIHLELVVNLHHRFVVPALWILAHTMVSDETIMLRYTFSTDVMYSDHIQLANTWQQFAPQIVERCVSAVSCFSCSVSQIILCQHSNTYLCWDFVFSFTWSLNTQQTWLCSCLDSGRILGWLFFELSSKNLQFGLLVVCSISSVHALFWRQCVTLSTHLAVLETTPSSSLVEHHVLHLTPQCADLHRLSDRSTVSGNSAGFFPWRQAPVLIFPHISKCRRPLANLILGYHHLFRPSTLWILCLCSGLGERSRLLSRWWPDSRYVWKHHGCTWPLAADHDLHSHFCENEPASFLWYWVLQHLRRLIKIINNVISAKTSDQLCFIPGNLNCRVQHHELALFVDFFTVIRDNPSSSFSTVNPSEQSSLVLTASRSPIFVNTKPMHPKNSWSELHHDPEQFNLPFSSLSLNGLDHCVTVFPSCISVDPTTKDSGIFTFFAALTSWTLWWFFDPIFRDRCSCVLGLYLLLPLTAILLIAPLPCWGDSHTPMLPCFGCRCHDRKKCICSATRLLGRHPSRCSAPLLLALRVSRRVSLACARCRGSATHGLLTEVSTGVLWVLTGTHPCDTPSRQGDGTSERQFVLRWPECCGARTRSVDYAVVTFCSVFFLHTRTLNLYNPSKMSSCGIMVINIRIPSHFESNSWVLSFRREIVNRST